MEDFMQQMEAQRAAEEKKRLAEAAFLIEFAPQLAAIRGSPLVLEAKALLKQYDEMAGDNPDVRWARASPSGRAVWNAVFNKAMDLVRQVETSDDWLTVQRAAEERFLFTSHLHAVYRIKNAWVAVGWLVHT